MVAHLMVEAQCRWLREVCSSTKVSTARAGSAMAATYAWKPSTGC